MPRRKSRSKKDQDIEFLQQALESQTKAIKEGPKNKKFTIYDLKNIKPLTFGQKMLFESYFNNNNIVANGTAGTGKSYCAIYLALTDLLRENSQYDQIIIIRSAVPSREIGYLPGEIDEKMSPYEEPYKDIFADLLRKCDAYNTLKDSQKLKFMPTSFVRGLTWSNSIVLIDEAQSMTFHEINSVITRIGENSRLIVCGDVNQNDLINKKNEKSGYIDALNIFSKMKSIEIVNFTVDDIVRSEFVKQLICASEEIMN